MSFAAPLQHSAAIARRRLAVSQLLRRLSRLVADPFDHLLRSIESDELSLEPVGSTDVHARAADSGSLPELSDFVTLHYARLIRLAGLVTRNGADAEDAVQSALERAWKRRADLVDPAALKSWLDRIVVREASRISGSRVRRLSRLLVRFGDTETDIDVVDRRASMPGELADMHAAFSRLSTDQRAVVSLHLYAGYSVAETADIVRAPVETVRSRLRLARQKLRSELELRR